MALKISGYSSWKGAFGCQDPVLRESAVRCNETTRWDNVVAICSKIRGGIACSIGENFTTGSQNFVKPIQFKDGVKWVIRIPLDVRDTRWAAKMAERIASEVATYKYLKQHTSIPVPEVHGYDFDAHHEIGVPYMLLTYLDGTLAKHVELDEEQACYVHQQVISIMLELANQQFDRIGNLIVDDSGFFSIGKEMETDQGPFTTAGQYYNALSNHRFHGFADNYFADNLTAESCHGLELPFVFNNLMAMFTNCAHDCGPFSLANTDLGFHNIILNATCKIIGLIDCDNIIAAPIHVVAQIPALYGLRRAPPGLKIGNSRAGSTYRKGEAGSARFVTQFKIAEAHYEQGTPISEAMTSDAARLVEGLECYGMMNPELTGLWAHSYFYIYYRRLRGSSGGIQFLDPFLSADVGDEPKVSESDDNDTVSDEQETGVNSPELEAEEIEAEEAEAPVEVAKDQPNNPTLGVEAQLNNSSAQNTMQTLDESKTNAQQKNLTDAGNEGSLDMHQQGQGTVEEGANCTKSPTMVQHNDQEPHITCAVPHDGNNEQIHEFAHYPWWKALVEASTTAGLAYNFYNRENELQAAVYKAEARGAFLRAAAAEAAADVSLAKYNLLLWRDQQAREAAENDE